MLTCRILPTLDSDGPDQMALDAALLDSVAADGSAAVFRTYRWSPPTLSLGYFQPAAAVETDPRWRDVPLVRRATGGGAIWHHHEITYALIVPRTHPLAGQAPDLYRVVHEAIASLLRAHGVAAHRRGEGTPGEIPSGRPFLCFADRDPADILVQGFKVVGSAQRRRGAAVLQHGSLLLRGSVMTPEFPGLGDLVSPSVADLPWEDWLRSQVPTALDLHPRLDEVAPHECERASDLANRVYQQPSWTRRR